MKQFSGNYIDNHSETITKSTSLKWFQNFPKIILTIFLKFLQNLTEIYSIFLRNYFHIYRNYFDS